MPSASTLLSADETRALLAFAASLPENATLQNRAEMAAATHMVESIGLKSHHDDQKNWDSLKCLHRVLESSEPTDRILDVGASKRSVILEWLDRLGYRELHACDLRETSNAFKGTNIQFSVQDLSKTNYPDGHFRVVTSISVIEHGVDLDACMKEMGRIIAPGGWLLTSTDYWSEPIDCSGIFPYGPEMPEMKVFEPAQIEALCKDAEQYGFELASPLELETADRAVHWERVDRRYTFVYFALRRRQG